MPIEHREKWELMGGSAPSHWQFSSIEELLLNPKSIAVGVMYPGGNTENGVPLIKVGDVKNGRVVAKPDFLISEDKDYEYRRTRIEGNELLITLVGNPGDCVLATEEMVGWNVARAIAALRLRNPDLRKWVRYVCLSQPSQHFFDSRLNTTVQKTLNLKDIKELVLPIPPDAERDAITEFIDAIEQKIELNRQMNATLEAMAQALFKSWFVDFDPVIDNALAAGNPIPEPLQPHAQARAALGDRRKPLPAAIQQQFPSRFVFNDELGWVPEGWEVFPLDKIAHYQNGLALQNFRPENETDYLPVVKIAQLKKGWADGEEKASSNIKPECIIDDGDVIFSWSGSLVVDIWCGGKAALNQHLFKVTSENYPKWFYHKFTEHHLHEFQRIAADKAVTMGHIKREHLSQAYCATPSPELLGAISHHFDSLMVRGVANRVENRQLEVVRDTLLPKLLSGQLRIPAAEKQISEAL